MKAERTTAAAFTVTFDGEEELRDEHRTNLSFGALRLPTTETVALHTLLLVTLRGPWGGESFVQARVVAALPGGIALAFEGKSDEILERLLAKPAEPEPAPEAEPEEPEAADTPERTKSSWDRVRALSQMEKILLAIKADRSERALLLQDSDPRVLLSLLRNPRLTMEEVVRLAKSSYLTFQLAEAIMKGPWMGNLDVRLGLIHNGKTPTPFALRILPTIPDTEVRTIARSAMSTALKQAAVRRLQGK